MTGTEPAGARYEPRGLRRHRRRRRIAVVTGVAVLAAGGLTAGLLAQGDDRRGPQACAPGVYRHRGECVGVTDGRYAFAPELREVSAAIAKENRAVERSGGDWVTVAYTEPMTRRPGGPAADRGPEVVRQALEGAYTAQRLANTHGGQDDRSDARRTGPQIKLLLANSGQSSAQWRPLIRRLKTLARRKKHPLVGVAGFGQSLESTDEMVGALRTAGIPMVGSTVAADSLSRPRPYFFRVSSPNADQASIAARYLRGRQRAEKDYAVWFVQDVRGKDSYNATLSKDFAARADKEKLRLEPVQTFESGDPSAATSLDSIASRMCAQHPDAVYFAGRGRELRMFMRALADPTHTACPVTVVSGSSAIGVRFDQAPGTAAWDPDTQGLRLLFTAYAHPEAYRDTGRYRVFARAHDRTFRHPMSEPAQQSGQAMMGYDAVRAFTEAVEDARGPGGRRPATPAAVHNALLRFRPGGESAEGLSGAIRFDERGNPLGKSMALVELTADGRYAFEELRPPVR